MAYLIAVASVAISAFVALAVHPFNNEFVTAICLVGLSIIFALSLAFIGLCDDNINDRLKKLEEKLKDKENDK